MEKINLSDEIAKFFAMFEIVEQGFERKLQSNEFPYNLYIQNIQNTSAASTCLVIKKWFFNIHTELDLSSNDLLETFFFYQVNLVNRSFIIYHIKFIIRLLEIRQSKM